MENQSVVYVEKKNGFWKFVKVALAVAAVAFVAVKVYQKFFKKTEIEMDEELDTELESLELDLSDDVAEEDVFEASADAVIANAEDMEAATEEA